MAKTEAQLRALGFGVDVFSAHRSNFAGLPQVLAASGRAGADLILADLGVSSMQLDDPARGFSLKHRGPLDMRMNPERGQPAGALLQKIKPETLALLLSENSDEPRTAVLSDALAGREFSSTTALVVAIRAALPRAKEEEREASVRRVFQALRIAVNDEFSALEAFLRHLPRCLNAGGRVAILTFHSGEDRRVKHAFAAARAAGDYAEISDTVIRPSSAERNANPRSTSAKLRWARVAPLMEADAQSSPGIDF